MRLEKSFQDFAEELSGIPHLAARIIGHLGTADCLEFLRAGRVFRQFFLLAIGHSSSLREQINNDVAMATITKGCWTRQELKTVMEEGKFDPSHFREILMVNDNFYAVSDSSDKALAQLRLFNTTGKCATGGTCIATGDSIRVQIDKGPKLIVDNGDAVEVIGHSTKDSVLMKKGDDDMDVKQVISRFSVGNNTYKLIKKEGDSRWELVFFDENLATMCTIPLTAKPTKILKQVC